LAFDGFQLLRTSKACPLVDVFGGDIKVKKNNRIGDPIVKNRNICMMLKTSCCTETTFVNYRDQWDEAKIYLEEYYKFSESIKNYFVYTFPSYGFTQKPKRALACNNTAVRPICDKKYNDFKKSLVPVLARFDDGINSYRKCIDRINVNRTKILCASCDKSMKTHLNVVKSQLLVSNADFEPLIMDCWEWLEFEFGPLGNLWKTYYDYAKLLDPKVNLNLDNPQDTFVMAKPEVIECVSYIRSPGKTGQKFNPLESVACLKVGKLLSSWIFFMPKFTRISDDTYNFYMNLARTLGARRSTIEVRGKIPTALLTRTLTKKLIGKSQAKKRILASESDKK